MPIFWIYPITSNKKKKLSTVIEVTDIVPQNYLTKIPPSTPMGKADVKRISKYTKCGTTWLKSAKKNAEILLKLLKKTTLKDIFSLRYLSFRKNILQSCFFRTFNNT